MNYYKSQSGQIFGFSDVQPVPEGLTPLTQAELDAFLNPVPTLDAAKLAQKAEINPIQIYHST